MSYDTDDDVSNSYYCKTTRHKSRSAFLCRDNILKV